MRDATAVARILAGVSIVRAGGTPLLCRDPDRLARLRAEMAYDEALDRAAAAGVPVAADGPAELVRRGDLPPDWADRLAGLDRDREEALVALWGGRRDAGAAVAIRRTLATIRAERGALAGAAARLDPYAREAVAAAARARVLVGCSLQRPDGTPHWADPDAAQGSPDPTLDAALAALLPLRLADAELRKLARSAEWAAVWAGRDHGDGLFGRPAADWGEEQRSLAFWAARYDQIRQCEDGPTEEEMADDDLVDGFVLARRREADRQRGLSRVEQIHSAKIRGSQEVFLMANSAKDAAAIAALNSAGGKAAAEARFEAIRQNKVLREHLPEAKG